MTTNGNKHRLTQRVRTKNALLKPYREFPRFPTQKRLITQAYEAVLQLKKYIGAAVKALDAFKFPTDINASNWIKNPPQGNVPQNVRKEPAFLLVTLVNRCRRTLPIIDNSIVDLKI